MDSCPLGTSGIDVPVLSLGSVRAHSARAGARAEAEPLVALAERLGTAPSTLAYAFALTGPSVASVVSGATSPEQIAENVVAQAVPARLTASERAELARIGESA